jgi:hypothetical protein
MKDDDDDDNNNNNNNNNNLQHPTVIRQFSQLHYAEVVFKVVTMK